MTRPRILSLTIALLVLVALPLAAQTSTGVPAPRSTAPGAPGMQHGKQQPCWQVAGISQQAMQQRKSIEENTRSQVQSVCANTSLSQEQKREQIRQLREQARKQIEGLITPQQEESLKSCREQRGGGENHGGGMHHGGGEGPCGDMPAGNGHPNNPKPPQSQSEPDQL